MIVINNVTVSNKVMSPIEITPPLSLPDPQSNSMDPYIHCNDDVSYYWYMYIVPCCENWWELLDDCCDDTGSSINELFDALICCSSNNV